MNAEQILIVDDDELVRTGLALDLEGDGYTVLTASSADEALACLAKNPVQLILSDLIMAEKDGIDLLTRVRENWPETAFIMITGHGTVGRALESMRRGAHDFLQKPVDPEVIRHRVRTVLDELRLRRTMLADRHKERERREALQRRHIRDQRMVSLGRLADGVSDYLADTLAPVFKCSEQITDLLPEGHPALEHVADVRHAADKTRALIQDLHTIGRGGHLKPESVQLGVLIEHWLQSEEWQKLKATVPALHVNLKIGEKVPPLAGAPDQLTAMVRNLVAHALEGMPQGGTMSVQVSVETLTAEHTHNGSVINHGGTYVVLKLEDSAVDPPVQDMERIFEPFQPRRVGNRIAASGLGLSVVYRVVQEHHGFIDVQAHEDNGTSYLVYLPAAAAPDATKPSPASDLSGHETILVLDDNDEHREQAMTLLRDLGYAVVGAHNSAAALEVVRKAARSGGRRTIHLAILDLVLGEAVDGLETYKRLQEIQPGQKAILVSGFAEFNRIVEARKLGLGRYVQKPYRMEALGKAVREELDRA